MRSSSMPRFRTGLPASDKMTDTCPFSASESCAVSVIGRANIGNRCTFRTAIRPFPAAVPSRRDEATRLSADPVLPAQSAGIFSAREFS